MKKRQYTTKIILHCAATPEGRDVREKDIRQWHIQRGFETTGYHYVIDLDGTVEKGRPEEYVGAHCLGQNNCSIGICYVGGCDKYMKAKDTRTDAQKKAMYELVKQMIDKYHIQFSQIFGHRDFQKNKECPSFDIATFKHEYNEYFTKKRTCPNCGHVLES